MFLEEVSVFNTLAQFQYECANGACTLVGRVCEGKGHRRTGHEGPEGE